MFPAFTSLTGIKHQMEEKQKNRGRDEMLLQHKRCCISFVITTAYASRQSVGVESGLAEEKWGSPVNHVVRVKVDQSLQSTVGNGSYFHLLEGFLVDCGDNFYICINDRLKTQWNLDKCFVSSYLLTGRRRNPNSTPSPAGKEQTGRVLLFRNIQPHSDHFVLLQRWSKPA